MREILNRMRDINNGIIKPKDSYFNKSSDKNLSIRDTLAIMRTLKENSESNDKIIIIDANKDEDGNNEKRIFNQNAMENQFTSYFNDNDIFYEIKFGEIKQFDVESNRPKIEWRGVFIIDDGNKPNTIIKEIRWIFKIPQIGEGFDIQYIGVSKPNTDNIDNDNIETTEDVITKNVEKITSGIKHQYKLFNEYYIQKTK